MDNELIRSVFSERQLRKQCSFIECLDMLNTMNLLNIGELAEKAIAKSAGVQLCSPGTAGIDTTNGVEIKHAQTHPERGWYGNTLPAYISKKNKSGPIAAIVTENLTKKQYYFFIHHYQYSEANGNCFTIPFENDGTPRRVPKREKTLTDWWKCEIKTYKEFCTLINSFK